ncbi:hypothetical protein ACL02T_10775 [Pseudonocardia sp. RS010]|uniref:hypothetical protein n=1 Tax=Pseudonocardia sp. RS010 TaxID=3385979 RepID=UPI0039A10F9E
MPRTSNELSGVGPARGVCPVCSRTRRVGAGGLFHRHLDRAGSRCTGSYQPLHEPGRDSRTVSTFALLHDRRCDNVVLAQMSPRPGTAQMVLTVACDDGSAAIGIALGSSAVQELVDYLDEWAQSTLAATVPLLAAALATGESPSPAQTDWTAVLPATATVHGSPRRRLKVRTCGRDVPLLALAALHTRPDGTDNTFAVLDYQQVCLLRDGLRLWLAWTHFLTGTGLVDPDPRPEATTDGTS